MLHLTLYTVSKTPKGPFLQLSEEYKKYLAKFTKLEHRTISSTDYLLKRIDSDYLVVLDAAGKTLTSESFAKMVDELDADGRKVTVVIGGPFGLPQELKEAANLRLSLSPMTTTHDLALVFFLEQLFRAFSINRGTEYHK